MHQCELECVVEEVELGIFGSVRLLHEKMSKEDLFFINTIFVSRKSSCKEE